MHKLWTKTGKGVGSRSSNFKAKCPYNWRTRVGQSHSPSPIREKTFGTVKMRFGREIRSVGFKERQRKHVHVKGGSMFMPMWVSFF
ncbi:putative extracellular matrix protein 2-like isoform X1 [Sesbania bispinosa]|nr:putative extracellular matrix protein 2-like isoform X1 [Sesbania bispinosa]